MKFNIIEGEGYTEYIREGECNRCSLCCCKNTIGVFIEAHLGDAPDGSDSETDWDLWAGYSHFHSQGINWWVKFNVKDKLMDKPCARLIDGECVDWKTDEFKAVCRYFPVHPRDIEKFPECGFSFRKVEDEREAHHP